MFHAVMRTIQIKVKPNASASTFAPSEAEVTITGVASGRMKWVRIAGDDWTSTPARQRGSRREHRRFSSLGTIKR